MKIALIPYKAHKTVLIGLFLIISGLCWAQEKSNETATKTLSEVVITATKFETPLRETSRPVQIISRAEIERSGAQNLAQVLQRHVGIIVNGAYGNPGTVNSLYVRGANYEFTSILINGIPVGDPAGIGGTLDFRLLQLGQVERIEIMKGSQSSLYGSGAISGVVNIITKQGGKDKIGISGNILGGVLNTGKATLNVGGQHKKFSYNVGAQHFFTEGMSDAAPPVNAKDSTFEKDRFVQTGVTTSIGFAPIEQISIKPYLRFTRNEGEYDSGPFADATDNHSRSDLLNTGIIADYRAKKVKARLGYGYTKTDRAFFSPGERKFKGRLHDLDGYASYKFNNLFNLAVGVNYQVQQAVEAAGENTDPSASILSPYCNALVTPLPALILELGGRLNVHSQYGTNLNYSAAAAYWITKNIKAFASYNTGYKAPTLGQLYGQFGANKSLQPQTSVSWEVGGQYHLIKGMLEGTVVYYNRKIDNLIVYAANGYTNRDLQQNSGVETTIKWSANKKVDITLVYDFMTGSITERKNQLSDSSYNNLIRRPEHSVKVNVMYSPISRLSVNLGGQYIGQRKDLFFDPQTYIAQSVNLDAYFLLNAYLTYEAIKEKMTFFVDLKNITDSNFYEAYGYKTLGFNARFGIGFKL